MSMKTCSAVMVELDSSSAHQYPSACRSPRTWSAPRSATVRASARTPAGEVVSGTRTEPCDGIGQGGAHRRARDPQFGDGP